MSAAPIRVLLVDDTLAQRYVLMRALEHAGCDVIQAASGTEALRLANEGADVIVLDVHLPDVDGFAVVRHLRNDERTAKIPVIHVSAVYVSPEHRDVGIASGADDYLVHPVDPEQLVSRVRALAGRQDANDS